MWPSTRWMARALLLALLMVATTAAAQPEGEDATAEAEGGGDAVAPEEPAPSPYQIHMDNGVRLFKAGLWDGAIAEFEAAYRAEPKASPLINLALTYKKIGDPVKAIEVLEKAVANHRDTMPADQIAAAKAEIAEMKTLLAYVKVEVTPSVEGVTLIVDDQEREGFASGQELVLPPGTRVFRARAKGYAEAEARAQVVSGHGNEAVQLNLKPTHGEVIITARHTDAWIEVDGQNRGKGLFQDMLTPGVHQIRVLRGKQIDSVQIVVQAGSRYTVTQDEDGELESDATAPLQEPEEEPSILPSFLRGFYGQGSAAFLAAFPHIDDLEVGTADRFGGAGGLHLGYRVTTWAAFEVFGQYSDIRASGDPGPKLQASLDATTNEITMVLKSVRAGGLLRVMLPGKSWIRFVGTVGGGVTIEWLEWRGESLDTTLFLDDKGVGPFGQLDLGVEFEFQGVLIDVVMQNILQTTKHFDLKNDRNAFDTQPIPIIGPAIRGGYALW